MGSNALVILIALTVGLAGYGVAALIAHAMGTEQRRIKQRLWSSNQPTLAASSHGNLLLDVQTPLPGALGRLGIMRSLHRRLLQSYPDASFVKFLLLMGGLAFTGFLFLSMLMESATAGLIGAGAAGYLPLMVVNGRRARRQRTLAMQLPEALDFLSRVLRAGHSLTTGLQMMGEELREPLGAEFRRCYSQHSLGQPLEDSMREMAGRIESADFAFFVTAVLIQRQTGGDLAAVLTNIANMIRQRIRLAQHVKAITAEGRMTSYILVAFPIVLFMISYTLNPDYAGLLLRTDTGRLMTGAAAGLVFIGLMVIRRIVTVKI